MAKLNYQPDKRSRDVRRQTCIVGKQDNLDDKSSKYQIDVRRYQVVNTNRRQKIPSCQHK